MKLFAVLTLFICLFVVSQPGITVDIADTYSNGDTLTATQMNNIKSAVNSKQDRVSGICAPEQSIAAINVDGSVICEDDSDSGGDITGVTAGSGLSGGGTDGTVTLSLSGAVSVHAAAFNVARPQSSCFYERGNVDRGYMTDASGSGCFVVASIQLPDGVTLGPLDCLVEDSSQTPGNELRVSVYAINLNDGSANLLYITNLSNDSGLQTISDDTPFLTEVDNSTYAYSIFANFGNAVPTTGLEVSLRGCRVSYQ